jgi:hypothetical protein
MTCRRCRGVWGGVRMGGHGGAPSITLSMGAPLPPPATTWESDDGRGWVGKVVRRHVLYPQR